MDVTHTVGYNGNEHSDFVRRYGLIVPTIAKGDTFVYGGDKGAAAEAKLTGDLQLTQPGHSSWALTGAAKATGTRFGGWAGVKGKLVMGLRDAWQQWPVSFSAAKSGDVTLDIYGGHDETFLDLRYSGPEGPKYVKVDPNNKWLLEAPIHKSASMFTGAKLSSHYGGNPTHRAMGIVKISELVIDFTPGADAASVGNGHHKMLIPWPGAKRFSDTRVFGLTGYYYDDETLNRLKDYFGILLDYPYVTHSVNGMFGWVDWPDAPDFGKVGKDGRFDDSIFLGGVGWTNGERQVTGYMGHYVATGSRRALEIGHASALHTIGFDVEHVGGDQKTGACHRHSQVHWGSAGGPRQAAWRGWYMDYWLTGHNEIRRGLDELHYIRYGVSTYSARARWPWHPQSSPKILREDHAATVVTVPDDGSPFHWMNHARWITTGDAHYAGYIDYVMEFWRRNPYVRDGKNFKHAANFKVDLTTGKMTYPAGVEFPPVEKRGQVPPFYAKYYWGTYGGAALLSEWAQLTGSTEAVDAILDFGDRDASIRRGANRTDKRNSDNRAPGVKVQQIYSTYEGIAPAYALLRKDKPELVDRWVKAMKWRMLEYPYGSVRNMAKGAKPLPLDDYTGSKWKAMNILCHGQNGHKIYAAVAYESLHTLYFMMPGSPATQPAK